MFDFKDEYLIGATAIDEQHKQLFRLAQRFHEAVVAHKGRTMLDELFAALLRYTTAHFQVEERLMGAIGYPERQAHSLEHDDLRNKLQISEERFEHGEMVTIQLLHFMNRLTAHITSIDRKLGEYQRARKESRARAV